MHRIAIYDMDKTITRRPTWTRFLVHAARERAPWRLAALPLAGLAAAGYGLKLLDRGGLKQTSHRLLLGRLSEEQAARLAQGFAAHEVAHGLFAAALARIAHDRGQGYRIVLATASYRFYAGAIAAALGIDDVIGTVAERDVAGRLLPKIAGENCYGAAKRRMIEDWLAAQGIARDAAQIRFYSDHASDAPSFALADEPFVVNPHAKLRRLAQQRGWPELDWG